MIMERRDGAIIREAAIAAGMKTMFQDGLAKALLGDTTLEEVFRVALSPRARRRVQLLRRRPKAAREA